MDKFTASFSLKMKHILLVTGLVLNLNLKAQDIPREAIKAANQIESYAIRAHMRFLADDLLEGREPFSRGYQLAALYMASEFEEMGLKPGMGDTSYYQTVELYKNRSAVEGSLTLHFNQETRSLIPGQDFILISEPDQVNPSEKGIVFGGIGVEDPSLDYHDLEKLDVRNKYVILYYWHPEDESAELTIKHMHNQRIMRLKEAGAAGVIFFMPEKIQERLSWERFKFYFGQVAMKSTYLDFPVFFIDWKIINDLFNSTSPSLEEYDHGNVRPSQFKIKASLSSDLQIIKNFEIKKSPNVLAYVEGSDPELKNEFVIYTAHLDHEGIGRPIEGDSIFNGAYDNASGTAILLEIARAYTTLPVPPRRSILFIALTAEELGLLGSEYFVNHPTIPLDNMVASLNTDMFLMEKPFTEMVALGEEFSSLGTLAHRVALEKNVSIIPDPLPEENIFMRSDHYNFVKIGIPSLFIINSYYKSDTLNEKSDANYRWLKTLYHTPLDNFREDIHYEAGVTYAQINFLIGYLAANQQERIKWNFDFAIENPLDQHR